MNSDNGIGNDSLYGTRSDFTNRAQQKPEMPKFDWDMEPDPAPEMPLHDSKWLIPILKSIKLIAYIVSFGLVLAGALFSKLTLLLMTSQLKESKTVDYCLKSNDATEYTATISAHERSQWIWCIFFVFFVPEGLVLLRSARMCIFKKIIKPQLLDFIVVGIFETLHTIGIALLVYVVLPDLEATKGAMLTNCVALVPAILSIFSRHKEKYRRGKTIADICAAVAQFSGLIVWPVLFSLDSSMKDSKAIWALPISILFISLGWWENYIDKRSEFKFIKFFSQTKERLKLSRYSIYFFISIWKILVFLMAMTGFIALTSANGWEEVKFVFNNILSVDSHNIQITGVSHTEVLKVSSGAHSQFNSTIANQFTYPASSTAPVYILLVQIFSAFIAYSCTKFACRICIQGFGFAFPVNLVMPVAVTLLISACGNKTIDVCNLQRALPPYIYWDCNEIYKETLFTHYETLIWIPWLISQVWITIHIWIPNKERLSNTEKLFILPEYSGVLLDQSLSLNRRREEEDAIKIEEVLSTEENIPPIPSFDGSTYSFQSSENLYSAIPIERPLTTKIAAIPRIYACATMWHENKKEMLAMLQSIFRMDSDHSARRLAQTYLGIVDPDYYEFTTHIFFDDAFQRIKINGKPSKHKEVNPFVRELYAVMNEAGCKVHGPNLDLPEPKKYKTPYGGRLEWALPGNTKLYVHLKDRDQIRHRKRWSQCMYMFYLLRHLHQELVRGLVTEEEKKEVADNTFLLALDGDIDFKPDAVQLLIDLMKKNKKLGAACGRIHPTGSGWMVWYQKFEYAIGHWLQKATEHILGCVLCSPGCFSLFRGSALLNNNVMTTYTTTSQEARHYVQYDQGEDRWLCTLLLQQGYRVEYSAAADAFTHCPESFAEFFNQRRRWLPSTMANILDLLMASSSTIKINDNISLPYILYQALLMGGTILGPGTIFLMLVGAFVAAFGIASRPAFYLNLIPISLFVAVCFLCKPKVQIRCAEVLTAIYSMVMMAVFVGICLQVKEDGWSAPSSMFLVIMFGSMVIAAFLHPLEIGCILHILLYWMVIPSMYLLLVIFSLTNMHDVSWGTRENVVEKTKEELEIEARELEEAEKNEKSKKKSKRIFNILEKTGKKYEGGCGINCGSFFTCLICGNEKPTDDKVPLIKISDTLEMINKRLDKMDKMETRRKSSVSKVRSQVRFSVADGANKDLLIKNPNESETEDSESYYDNDTSETEPEPEDSQRIPNWHECLGPNNILSLPPQERDFWPNFIARYLKPIDENKAYKKKVLGELTTLRNKMVFTVFMFNALFILVVSLLQMNKDTIYINWPLNPSNNITYDDRKAEIHVGQDFLHLEPTGFIFIIFFGIIIAIQFVSMLFHRMGTMVHLLASTEIDFCARRVVVTESDARIQKQIVDVVRNMQRLHDYIPEEESIYGNTNRMAHHGARNRRKTLDDAFMSNFMRTGVNVTKGAPVLTDMKVHKNSFHPEALKLVGRRASIFVGRRNTIHMDRTAEIEQLRNQNRQREETPASQRHSHKFVLISSGIYNAHEDSSSHNSNDEPLYTGENSI